jgi:hypothetical protein
LETVPVDGAEAGVRRFVVVPKAVLALAAIPDVIATILARQRLYRSAICLNDREPGAIHEDGIDISVLAPLPGLKTQPIVITAAGGFDHLAWRLAVAAKFVRERVRATNQKRQREYAPAPHSLRSSLESSG